MSRREILSKSDVAYIERALGRRVICDCGATLATFDRKCRVAVSEPCGGFAAIVFAMAGKQLTASDGGAKTPSADDRNVNRTLEG